MNWLESIGAALVVVLFLVAFLAFVCWLLDKAREKPVSLPKRKSTWFEALNVYSDTDVQMKCRKCGHTFMVSPHGEINLYWHEQDQVLKTQCPKCGIKDNS
jgi:ribosomal protein S27E